MKTITRAEYLQLLGLLTLAHRHNKHLHELHAAAAAITGELGDADHTADQVYNPEPNIDVLLEQLDLTVADDSGDGAQRGEMGFNKPPSDGASSAGSV